MTSFPRGHSAPPATPGRPEVRADVVSTALSSVAPYCSVVDAHLHDVIDQTAEAAESILHQLINVDALADAMASDAERLAGAVGRTEAELSQATALKDQLMDRLTRSVLERDERISGLVAEMSGLSRQVARIEQVNRATTVVAFDAMIEAVRSGDAGEGCAVVADELRKLTDRSTKAAGDIGDAIAELTTRLDAALSDDSEIEGAGVPAGAKGGATAVAGLLGGLANAQHDMSRIVARVLRDTVRAAQQVERSSHVLTVETSRAVGHVQFQDISRQMIEHVAEAVADVQRQAEDVIAYTQGEVPGETMLARMIRIDDLRDKHVMGRQRSIHSGTTGSGALAGTESVIELF